MQTLVKLLFTYGPFALLVWFVYGIHGKAWNALKESTPDTKRICKVVYSLVWVTIFSLVIFICCIWYWINILPDEYTIAGTFKDLKDSEGIFYHDNDPDLYIYRQYHALGYVSEHFRLVKVKRKMDDGTRVIFTFNRGPTTESKENVTDYGLIVRSAFYKENVEVRYDRGNNKFILTCGNIKEEILPVNQDQHDGHARKQGFLLGVAHADEPLAPDEFINRLESDDPIIRRDARMELGGLGEKALPLIQSALENPNSSYRQKLGFITALGNMKEVKFESLSQGTINAIIEASVDNDAALRGAALRFFGKHPSQELNTRVQQAMVRAKAEGANPERISRLARAQLEILYNLGIREKDEYRKPVDMAHFQAAVKYFQDAWGLHTLAVPDDQVYFTKALYGWGIALHDRSMIERSRGEERQPEMINAAQDKFQEFLRAYEHAPNKNKYPYPEHESCARAYLEKPVSQSLRK